MTHNNKKNKRPTSSGKDVEKGGSGQYGDYSAYWPLYGVIRSKVTGQLVLSIFTLLFVLISLIMLAVMWEKLSTKIQNQELVLRVCTSGNTDSVKASEIPRVSSDKKPQCHKTRFNLVSLDEESSWSKSYSSYRVAKTADYAMKARVTVAFGSPSDLVMVRLMGESDDISSSSSSFVSPDKNDTSSDCSDSSKGDGLFFYDTVLLSADKVLVNGSVVNVVDKVQTVELQYFGEVYKSTLLFVSVVQTKNSTAKLENVDDCGSNHFTVVVFN